MRYAWLTLKHKLFVLLAGLRYTKTPLGLLLLHDLSKLTWAELPGYQRQFFRKRKDPTQWAKTWAHHIERNPHHYEHWVQQVGGRSYAFIMPEEYVREMVADWIGASRAYEGRWPRLGAWAWLDKNLERVCGEVHPQTERMIRQVIREWKEICLANEAAAPCC